MENDTTGMLLINLGYNLTWEPGGYSFTALKLNVKSILSWFIFYRFRIEK